MIDFYEKNIMRKHTRTVLTCNGIIEKRKEKWEIENGAYNWFRKFKNKMIIVIE